MHFVSLPFLPVLPVLPVLPLLPLLCLGHLSQALETDPRRPEHIAVSPRGEVGEIGEPSSSLGEVLSEAALDKLGKPAGLGSLGELSVPAEGTGRRVVLQQKVRGSTPTGEIQLGTPPVKLQVIFDTGSDRLVAKTWDTVMRELEMVDSGISRDITPTDRIYNHNTSSTYTPQYLTVHGKAVPKRDFIVYGSGAVFTDEGNETVAVGGHTLTGFPLSEITADSLSMLHTKGSAAGVLGLQHMKNRTLGESVFSRSRDLNLMTAFGYCRRPADSGVFIWGDDSTEGHAVKVIGEIHWAVPLTAVQIARGRPGSTEKALAAKQDEPEKQVKALYVDGVGSDNRVTDASLAGGGPLQLAANSDFALQHGGVRGERSVPPEARGDMHPNRLSQGEHAAMPFCHDGACAAVIDTGSNIIAGPTAAVRTLIRDLGVKLDCSNLEQLPDITFTLGTVDVTLPAAAYVMKLRLPAWSKKRHHHSNSRHVAWLSADGEASPVQNRPGGTWVSALEDLQRQRGLDLRSIIEGVPDGHLASAERLCMPALVPLDKTTKVGALWVIGGPLFEQYYTRWSWPPNESSPTIFLQPLLDAGTCKLDPVQAAVVTVPEPQAMPGPGLMRSEGRQGGLSAVRPARLDQVSQEPPEFDLDELRYPRWATELMSI